MADWFLNPALTRFRQAVNARYGARRDKESDGTLGDRAHASRSSDHNPDSDGSVDAWDMDVDLNGRGQPYTADVEALKRIFEAHESSSYWIHNDQIAKRSNGWRRESYAYAGPSRNRHEHHVHWNTRQSHERSTAPWVLDGEKKEDDMAVGDDIYRLLEEGLRPPGTAQTAGGGVPIAWIVRKVAEIQAGQIEQKLRDEAILTAVRADADTTAIVAAVNARAAELAVEVNQVAAETVDELGVGDDPQVIADRLRAALGDKAAAVGALLASPQA